MHIEAIILTLIVIISCTSAQELDNLGPNLIINGDFSSPDLKAMGIQVLQYFPQSILGWNCSLNCQIVNCQGFNKLVQSWNTNQFGGDCPLQSIDISANNIEVISQQFEANAGEHILHLKFLCPITTASSKILVVMINQKIIDKFHPLFQDYNHKEISMEIILSEGLNKISLTTEGLDDPFGFRIFDVQIRRKIYSQATKTIQTFTNNPLLQSSVSIPCSRILFGEFINTMISFDRMQLYYYHQRKYSYYSDLFIKGVTDLLNQKGIYTAQISDRFLAKIGTSQSSILQIINFKKGRLYKNGYGKNNFMENGGLFFMASQIPVSIILFLTLNILFRVTSDNRLSRIFRKYSFVPIIVLMLFQGNIQQFSFLIMDELLQFFSASFFHKGVNITIVAIFYLILFCSTALYLYCWCVYKHKMSYLTDNIALKMKGIVAFTFDRGIICLLFGVVHRLTLFCGSDQLLILAAVQMLVIAFKAAFLLFTSYRCKMLGCLSIVEGVIRICFQISIFIYEDGGELRGFINDQIHLKIIYSFFLLWTLNFVFSIIEIVKQLHHKNPKCNSEIIYLKKQLTLRCRESGQNKQYNE